MRLFRVFSRVGDFANGFASVKRGYYKGNIPYKFGGLDRRECGEYLDENNNDLNMHMLQRSIGMQVVDGFKGAYRQILRAIYQKDGQYLGQVLEKGLVKEMRFPETRFVGDGQEIEVRIGKISIIKGGCYDREILSRLRFSVGSNNQKSVDLRGFAAVGENSNSNTFLFVFHVYFISKMKLVEIDRDGNVGEGRFLKNGQSVEQKKGQQKGQKDVDQEIEIHMVQFESEARHKGLFSILGTALRLFIFNYSNSVQFVTKYLRFLMNVDKKQFEWRVGDVDRKLKGNFTQ